MRCHYLLMSVLTLPALITAKVINLGTAAAFGVLGATTVTNTGLTVITGDLGVSPGTAITGFPPGVVVGTVDSANAVAAAAQADALTAYNAAAALAPTQVLTGMNLGGLTLTQGVYKFSSSAQLTGTLTLDAQGNSGAQFVFQIGSTITTATASQVLVINGAQACNVIWQVGSSATLGTGTMFIGDILANAAITVTTGSSNIGSLIALNAAVTLNNNRVSAQVACGSPSSSSTSSSVTSTTTPTSTMTVSSTPTQTSTAPSSSSTWGHSTTRSSSPTWGHSTTRSSSPTWGHSTTTSSTSTWGSSTSSYSSTPTSITICVIPNSPPVGGIHPPVCGCNDIYSDWVQHPFKLYNNRQSSQCPSYARHHVSQACKDACEGQLSACTNIYAESCKGKSQRGDQDSHTSAMTKCLKQYAECLAMNSNHGGGNHCNRFRLKFRN